MTKVPEFNKMPKRLSYQVNIPDGPASMKQKNYISTLCERRKIPIPDFTNMTKQQAAELLSNMLN